MTLNDNKAQLLLVRGWCRHLSKLSRQIPKYGLSILGSGHNSNSIAIKNFL